MEKGGSKDNTNARDSSWEKALFSLPMPTDGNLEAGISIGGRRSIDHKKRTTEVVLALCASGWA